MIRKYKLLKLVLLVVGISTGVVFGSGYEAVGRAFNLLRPDLKVQITGTVKRNDETVTLEKAAAVNSGEVLAWQITTINAGNAPAVDYSVVGQVPKGTEYIDGSATSADQPRVQFSVDNGASYSDKPTIAETQADGSVKTVPAPPSRYTQIKFNWNKEIPADSKLQANYRVRVK